MNRLPSEVKLRMIEQFDTHEVLRLRQYGRELPLCLQLVLTYKCLYEALKRQPDQNSIRPPLGKLERTPMYRKELTEREQIYWDRYDVKPRNQMERILPRCRFLEEWQVQQGYAAGLVERSSAVGGQIFALVLDVVNNKLGVIGDGSMRLAKLTLTADLLALQSERHVYVLRLTDLPFVKASTVIDLRTVCRLDIEDVQALTGNKSQIAIASRKHLYVYNYASAHTQRFNMPPFRNLALSWSEELCCVYSADLPDRQIQQWLPFHQQTTTILTELGPYQSIDISACQNTIRIAVGPAQPTRYSRHGERLHYIVSHSQLERVAECQQRWRQNLYTARDQRYAIAVERDQRIVLKIGKKHYWTHHIRCTDSFLAVFHQGKDHISISVLSFDQHIGSERALVDRPTHDDFFRHESSPDRDRASAT